MSDEEPRLWFESALLPGGWARRVRIVGRHGNIRSVDVDVDPTDGDGHHAIGIPGLANLHSHAFQRAIAGLTERRGPERRPSSPS